MRFQWRTYSYDDLVLAVAENKSIAGTLRQIGLIPAGGNYRSVWEKIRYFDLDTSHFKGQGWSAGDQLKPLGEYRRASHAKPHLITSRGHQCEWCQEVEWLDEPIPLEVDHINGKSTDNREENLRLLCPNCHALTPTYRGRNRGNK